MACESTESHENGWWERFEASLNGLSLHCSHIALTSEELEEPHFPRHPGFTCIVLTMNLYGQCCPQFAPKNSAADDCGQEPSLLAKPINGLPPGCPQHL